MEELLEFAAEMILGLAWESFLEWLVRHRRRVGRFSPPALAVENLSSPQTQK
jgi:hypothetical protein